MDITVNRLYIGLFFFVGLLVASETEKRQAEARRQRIEFLKKQVGDIPMLNIPLLNIPSIGLKLLTTKNVMDVFTNNIVPHLQEVSSFIHAHYDDKKRIKIICGFFWEQNIQKLRQNVSKEFDPEFLKMMNPDNMEKFKKQYEKLRINREMGIVFDETVDKIFSALQPDEQAKPVMQKPPCKRKAK